MVYLKAPSVYGTICVKLKGYQCRMSSEDLKRNSHYLMLWYVDKGGLRKTMKTSYTILALKAET
jgi:hypothetical protein